MIVFDESEQLESDFSDYTLTVIQALYGPAFKDMLLLPGPVVISGVQYDNILVTSTKLG
jgi:hypothetical protein